MGIANQGGAPAFNTRIVSSGSSRGAVCISGLPFSVGDITAGGASNVTVKYHVPAGISIFSVYNSISAQDTCGYTYDYPLRPAYKVYGIDFSPYVDGQSPNSGSGVDENQIRERLEIVRPYTDWIRTYGSAAGLEKIGKIAHEYGLKTAIGAWLSPDKSENELQIANLISTAQSGQADMVIVGNEALRKGLSEPELLSYIQRVKDALPGVKVATSETYDKFIDFPDLLDAVDVLMANYHPYWEKININDAVAALNDWHSYLTSLAHGKEVMVSETGWPTQGDPQGAAVPSLANASRYFLEFTSWARANHVPYFYFEAMDESWKVAEEGPQGAHWGIWDKDGNLKGGMQQVFEGVTSGDTWSGPASLEFTSVPAYGSHDHLYGHAWHVLPTEYKVALYIRVGGGWWNKPTWTTPFAPIMSNGTWEGDITTDRLAGDNDRYANEIAAFLVPQEYEPPRTDGSASLPADLYSSSLASQQVTRSP